MKAELIRADRRAHGRVDGHDLANRRSSPTCERA
jgi:hypothetical protein